MIIVRRIEKGIRENAGAIKTVLVVYYVFFCPVFILGTWTEAGYELLNQIITLLTGLIIPTTFFPLIYVLDVILLSLPTPYLIYYYKYKIHIPARREEHYETQMELLTDLSDRYMSILGIREVLDERAEEDLPDNELARKLSQIVESEILESTILKHTGTQKQLEEAKQKVVGYAELGRFLNKEVVSEAKFEEEYRRWQLFKEPYKFTTAATDDELMPSDLLVELVKGGVGIQVEKIKGVWVVGLTNKSRIIEILRYDLNKKRMYKHFSKLNDPGFKRTAQGQTYYGLRSKRVLNKNKNPQRTKSSKRKSAQNMYIPKGLTAYYQGGIHMQSAYVVREHEISREPVTNLNTKVRTILISIIAGLPCVWYWRTIYFSSGSLTAFYVIYALCFYYVWCVALVVAICGRKFLAQIRVLRWVRYIEKLQTVDEKVEYLLMLRVQQLARNKSLSVRMSLILNKINKKTGLRKLGPYL